jgi:hypothetical protein
MRSIESLLDSLDSIALSLSPGGPHTADQRGESAIWIPNSMRKLSWYSVTGKYPYLSAGRA